MNKEVRGAKVRRAQEGGDCAMAVTGAFFVPDGCWSVFRRDMKSAIGGMRMNSISVSTRPLTASSEQAVAPRVEEKGGKKITKRFEDVDVSEVERPSL